MSLVSNYEFVPQAGVRCDETLRADNMTRGGPSWPASPERMTRKAYRTMIKTGMSINEVTSFLVVVCVSSALAPRLPQYCSAVVKYWRRAVEITEGVQPCIRSTTTNRGIDESRSGCVSVVSRPVRRCHEISCLLLFPPLRVFFVHSK